MDEQSIRDTLETVLSSVSGEAEGLNPLPAAMLVAGAIANDYLRQCVSREDLADPTARMRKLAGLMSSLAHLFDTGSPAATLWDLAWRDVDAIAKGDDPRLFVPLPRPVGSRRRINAYRLAKCQVRALMWDAFLRSCGTSVAETQLLVGSAFGATHTTYSRWRDEVIRELGQDHFDLCIRYATDDKFKWMTMARTQSQVDDRLNSDGEDYKQEQRKHLKGVP